jgi:hypothetical protein
MMTEKGYSSSCPGRFRTTIQEINEEEIISPATNAGDDVDSDERSVSECRAYISRQDTSEMVWKRFRLLSIISLVRHISDSPVEVDPPAATLVDDGSSSSTSLYNHYPSSLTGDEEPNSYPYMDPSLLTSNSAPGSSWEAYQRDESWRASSMIRSKGMVLAEWEDIDLPRRIPGVPHTQIQVNQVRTQITQNNKGKTFLKDMWSRITYL